MTVGERLRQARNEKGLKLTEIQEQYKLPVHNLEALEKDDYDALGSSYNVKTLIRAYAKVLGLDEASLIHQYETGEEPEDIKEKHTEKQTRSAKKPARDRNFMKIIPIIILTIVFLIIIGSVAFAFLKESKRFNANSNVQKNYKVEDHVNDKKEEPKKEEPKPSKQPESSSSSEEKEVEIETISNALGQVSMKAKNIKGNADLKLTGTNGRCWVSVMAAGQSLYQGIVEMGAEQVVNIPASAKQVIVKTGNAPALDVTLNDKKVDFNDGNNVKQVSLSIDLEYLN